MTSLTYAYSFASGRNYTDCAFLGHRWDPEVGSSNDDSDRSIFRNLPAGEAASTKMCWMMKSLLTALWRAPSGTVYVADGRLPALIRYADLGVTPATNITTQGVYLEGVWGLDDDHVYVWGTRRRADGTREFPVMRREGDAWVELPAPGPPIVALHGLAPDLLFAVGREGYVGRFDGNAWHRYPMPTAEVLNGVFVAAPDEIYACGWNGNVFEGTSAGFKKIAENPASGLPLYDVAKFAGELWVGAGPVGLLRRVGQTAALESFKPKIKANHFEAHPDNLIITADNLVAGTTDGVKFIGTAIGSYERLTAGRPIMDYD